MVFFRETKFSDPRKFWMALEFSRWFLIGKVVSLETPKLMKKKPVKGYLCSGTYRARYTTENKASREISLSPQLIYTTLVKWHTSKWYIVSKLFFWRAEQIFHSLLNNDMTVCAAVPVFRYHCHQFYLLRKFICFRQRNIFLPTHDVLHWKHIMVQLQRQSAHVY